MKKILAILVTLSLLLSAAIPALAEAERVDFIGMWSKIGDPEDTTGFYETIVFYPDGLCIKVLGFTSLSMYLPFEYSWEYCWTSTGDRIVVTDDNEYSLDNGLLKSNNGNKVYQKQEWMADSGIRISVDDLRNYQGEWVSCAVGFDYQGAYRVCPAEAMEDSWDLTFNAPGEGALLRKYGLVSGMVLPMLNMKFTETRIEDGKIRFCQKGESGGFLFTAYENGWLSMGVEAAENEFQVEHYELFFKPKGAQEAVTVPKEQTSETSAGAAGISPDAAAGYATVEEIEWHGRWDMTAIGMDIDLGGGTQHYKMGPGIGVTDSQVYFDPAGNGVISLITNDADYYSVYIAKNCWAEENVIHTSQADLVYLPETGELSLTYGPYLLYYQKTEWPPQLGREVTVSSAEDYYGVWEECATEGIMLNYQGLIGGGLAKSRLYYEFNKNGGEKITISRDNGGVIYSGDALSDIRVKDGMLQIGHYGSEKEYYTTVTVYENGWISMKFNSDGTEYVMYFERNDHALDDYRPPFDNDAGDVGAPQQADPTAAPAAASGRKVRVNEGSNPNVRSKPGADGQKVGTAKSGKTYDLLDERDGWYKIRLEDGTEGWIAGGMAKIVKN